MKKLRKNQKKKTIEAYACICGTPDDCGIACAGDISNMDAKAVSYLEGLFGRK